MSICLNKESIDEVFLWLANKYDENSIVELNDEETAMLNDMSEKLNDAFKSRNVAFNIDGFKMLVRRLCPLPVNNGLIGGVGPLTEYNVEQRQGKYAYLKYDLTAIVFLLVSIYILFLSYKEFNSLACNITGNDITTLSEDARSTLKGAIEQFSNSDKETTFVAYIFNIFLFFGNKIVAVQEQRIRQIIFDSLSAGIVDFSKLAVSTCTGNADSIETLIKTTFYPTATASCISDTAVIYSNRFYENQKTTSQLLLTKLKTSTLNVINLTYIGASLGWPSLLYISYRIRGVVRENIKNRETALLEGGIGFFRKSRKFRKSMKQRKTRQYKRHKKVRRSKKQNK